MFSDWIVELDGNERRTAVATCDTPVWEGEDFVLPVHDPSSDLRLFLFDDGDDGPRDCA